MSWLPLRIAVLLSSLVAFGAAQVAPDTTGAELYRSPEYRFVLRIPAGWKIADLLQPRKEGLKQPFLSLAPISPGPPNTWITFQAEESPQVTGFDVDAASHFLHRHLGTDSDQHTPTATWIGGLRWDYVRMVTYAGTNKLYGEVLSIAVKGHIIIIWINSTSSIVAVENANDAISKSLSFIPDYSVAEEELDKSKPIVRISQGNLSKRYRSKPQPKYPLEAIKNRIQGEVELHVTFSRAGSVDQIWVLRGEPALLQPALDAVKKWTIEPYKLNGIPVRLDTQITVRFQLKIGR